MWSAHSQFLTMTSRSTAHCHLSPYNNGILAAGIASPVAEVVLFFLNGTLKFGYALAAQMTMLKEAWRSGSRRWRCNHLCGTEHSESYNDCMHKIRLLNATINSERWQNQHQQCKHSDHAGMTAMVKNHYSIGGYDCCTKRSSFGDGASSSTASGDRSKQRTELFL